MSVAELACSYAATILHDDGISITAEKIAKLVKAANVHVESFWPMLFAKLAEKRNLEDLILSAGAGGAAPVAFSASAVGAGEAAAAAVAAPAAEEKKESVKEEESDDDMGFSLFD